MLKATVMFTRIMHCSSDQILAASVYQDTWLIATAVPSAVPLTVFTLDYCIKYPACSVTEIAAKELKSVDFSEAGNGDFISRFRVPEAAPTAAQT